MLQKLKHIFSLLSIDKLGAGLSIVCAIHCIASPLFIALLPMMSSTLVHNHTIEVLLLGSSFIIVGVTNTIGFIRHHKKYAPLVYMFLGFSLIISGHVTHIHLLETGFAIIGALFVAFSIFENNRAKKEAKPHICACNSK